MRISVVILARDEEKRIGECLTSVVAQDYPRELYEVVVVDNDSRDATREIVMSFQGRLENLRLIGNPEIGIAPGRNLGLAAAAYEYVAFTDADCRVPPGWLSGLAEGFARNREIYPGLAAVGGTNRAPEGGLAFYEAVNIVLKTDLGNRGSTQGKEFGRDAVVDHVPTLNILYDRGAVLDQGGFDEAFRFVCEDPDLNYRLTKAGRVIVHLDGCQVEHAFAPGYLAWAKKIFRYGRGRSQLLAKHPDKSGFVYFVAPLIVALWVLAGLAPLFGWLLALPLAGYVSAMGVYAAFYCLKANSLTHWPRAMALYLITHASFGLGQITGWLAGKSSRP